MPASSHFSVPRVLLFIFMLAGLAVSPAGRAPVRAGDAGPFRLHLAVIMNPKGEWTLHKTPDGLHPDGSEQQMLWLMNHARANPPLEGQWLASSSDPHIAFARDYFGVDLAVLQSEFNRYSPKPPAAFDARMWAGSKAHADDLIARDTQDHDHQFERIEQAGFDCWGGRASVFAYAASALNAHGAFNIDWGGGTADGMQPNRGHRKAIMSLDGNYTNMGVALVPAPEGRHVGPLVTTAAYCYAHEGIPDHYNRFLVGTVWSDRNENHLYDPGEGIPGVTVDPGGSAYLAITGQAGGYAVPIDTPGVYTVTFSGPASGSSTVTVGEDSVLLDLLVP